MFRLEEKQVYHRLCFLGNIEAVERTKLIKVQCIYSTCTVLFLQVYTLYIHPDLNLKPQSYCTVYATVYLAFSLLRGQFQRCMLWLSYCIRGLWRALVLGTKMGCFSILKSRIMN